ncbi:MAG: peptidoglycan-binding protein [Hyphomicrobiaceae bacterium]|nr:peptidoglycan-binding protein [Hyphomicrobiaceae bacterium]
MLRILKLAAAALTVFAGSAIPALAKECKNDVVVAEGEPFISKNLGAYPSSLFAWRKAAGDKAGPGFKSWRVAEDRKIDCEQVNLEGKKRWVCTRSARPCQGIGGVEEKKFEFTRTLRRGDSGDDVKALQELLNGIGYELTVDGNYGRGTKEAVRDFQKRNGLSADGNFGPNTAEKMQAEA